MKVRILLALMIGIVVIFAVSGCSHSSKTEKKQVLKKIRSDESGSVAKYSVDYNDKLYIKKIDFSKAVIGKRVAYIPLWIQAMWEPGNRKLVVAVLERFEEEKDVTILSWSMFGHGTCTGLSVTFEPKEYSDYDNEGENVDTGVSENGSNKEEDF